MNIDDINENFRPLLPELPMLRVFKVIRYKPSPGVTESLQELLVSAHHYEHHGNGDVISFYVLSYKLDNGQPIFNASGLPMMIAEIHRAFNGWVDVEQVGTVPMITGRVQ
jgi:hypothetical protein